MYKLYNDFKYGIHIFHRDLRIYDNKALNALQKKVDVVIPIYIFDPSQIFKSKMNKYYYNEGAVQFICESVYDLHNQIRFYKTEKYKNQTFYLNCDSIFEIEPDNLDTLQDTNYYSTQGQLFNGITKKCPQNKHRNFLRLVENPCLRLFLGDAPTVVKKIIQFLDKNEVTADSIYFSFNTDYSLYSNKRDKHISEIIKQSKCHLIENHTDYNLLEQYPSELFYEFEQYYKCVKNISISEPNNKALYFLNSSYILDGEIDVQHLLFSKEDDTNIFCRYNPDIFFTGGRNVVINKLIFYETHKNFAYEYEKKPKQSAFLIDGSLKISAYLNVGSISVREAFYFIKNNIYDHAILKKLYLREFFLHASIHMPHAQEFRHMNPKFDSLNWLNRKSEWEQLVSSKTGFLMVDACMKELQITGFLHHNLRYLLGTFWTKYMLINVFHPKWGSQVGFSKYCTDAIGVLQNKYNHHYLTEFNYEENNAGQLKLDLKKKVEVSNKNIKQYDPDCVYIRKWLPHLSDIPKDDLLNWSVDVSKKYDNVHPGPIFEHADRYSYWLDMCFNLMK